MALVRVKGATQLENGDYVKALCKLCIANKIINIPPMSTLD